MRRPALCLAAALCLPAPLPAAGREAVEAGSTRDLYLLLIRQARADGRARAALAYLADFDRRYPGDVDARSLRIDCLLDLGQTQAARAAVALLPADANAMRGHVLAAEGRWALAATEYRAALLASPADPLLGNALGYALLRSGRAAEAVETLRAAADLAPGDHVVRNNLLLALTVAGRGAEAEAGLQAVADAAGRTALRRLIAEQAKRLSGFAAGAEG